MFAVPIAIGIADFRKNLQEPIKHITAFNMEYDTVFNSLRDIMRKVFDDSRLEIDDSTSARDINRWDSLNHVILISEVEKEFGIHFDLSDMLDIRTTGDICQAVLRLIREK